MPALINCHILALQIALVKNVGLDLGTTLIGSGIYNLYSGAAFGVPMPVQPMKSIAAVAITEPDFDLNETLLAGILVSAFILLLAVLKLIPGALLAPAHAVANVFCFQCAQSNRVLDAACRMGIARQPGSVQLGAQCVHAGTRADNSPAVVLKLCWTSDVSE